MRDDERPAHHKVKLILENEYGVDPRTAVVYTEPIRNGDYVPEGWASVRERIEEMAERAEEERRAIEETDGNDSLTEYARGREHAYKHVASILNDRSVDTDSER